MEPAVKYLSPLTLETQMFMQSFKNLSKTYSNVDVHLLEALEGVMNMIESFINDNFENKIVETEKTKLVKCDDLKNILKIYHCLQCNRDLGKASEKVVLHMTEGCVPQRVLGRTNENVAPQMNDRGCTPVAKGDENGTGTPKLSKRQLRKQEKETSTIKRLTNALKLTKKTTAFISMNAATLIQFVQNFSELGEKLKCIPDYKAIENDLTEVCKTIAGDKPIRIYKFGSRISGIGTRESDLDIFVDIDDTFNTFEHSASPATINKLHNLRDALKNQKHKWTGITMIDGARVPIIRILHRSSGIECDINISNGLGYINTEFLEYLYSLQPAVQYMCIYFKKWLTRTQLKEEFSTYSFNLLVLFYYQQLKFLPPLSKFFENIDMSTACNVGPWLGSFHRYSLSELAIEQAPVRKLREHLEGFFRFYLKFNFTEYVVCPYTGTAVSIANLNSVMPKRYIDFITDKPDMKLMDSYMTIQDPIQLNHNVAKRRSEYSLKAFSGLIALSLDKMAKVNS